MKKFVREPSSKVPIVTLGFWIIKIAATTLGQTGGDAVTMTMNLGYLIGTAIFSVVLIASVSAQIAAKRLLAGHWILGGSLYSFCARPCLTGPLV